MGVQYHVQQQAPVVQKLDSAIHRINLYIRETDCTIQWTEIYSVDSAIHLLNNWDQIISALGTPS